MSEPPKEAPAPVIGLGNIVDYPITPESSEEEEGMEVEAGPPVEATETKTESPKERGMTESPECKESPHVPSEDSHDSAVKEVECNDDIVSSTHKDIIESDSSVTKCELPLAEADKPSNVEEEKTMCVSNESEAISDSAKPDIPSITVTESEGEVKPFDESPKETTTIGKEDSNSCEEPEEAVSKDGSEQSEMKTDETGEETPETPTEEKPETPIEEKPETPTEEKPETPAEEKPETPIEEKPETPIEEKPETPTEEKPETPAEEKPETPIEEKPETPIEEKPETPIEEKPETPTEEKPETPTEEKPKTPTEETLETPIEEKPETPIEEQTSEEKDLSKAETSSVEESVQSTIDADVKQTKATKLEPSVSLIASQISEEFEPQISEENGPKDMCEQVSDEIELTEKPVVEGLEEKEECFPGLKVRETVEAMDVDDDESEATPTVEDTELLPLETEEVIEQQKEKKQGTFPVTDAFLDENSLSMDCVLAISSVVPEGEVSIDGSLCDSNVQSCPTPAKRSRPASVMSGLEPDPDLDEDGNFPAENLFEYQWPHDGGEWHMLQEQICEYLQVKSFKRKYPDLYRRTADKTEKDFLRERMAVTETQADLGLTALKSEEVYDLMNKDYPDKYREYAQLLHEKQRQNIDNKHKEYEVPKLDKGKMGDYIKKAVKATADFNAQFQRERREERKAYFDLQTFMIHYPAGRYKKLPPEATKPSEYPVALIPGQFQDYYGRYTPDELKYLPLNTALFDPPKKMSNPLVKPTSDQESSEVDESTEDKAGSASDGMSDGESSSGSDDSESEVEDAVSKEEPLAEPLPPEEKCRICNSVDPPPPEKKVGKGKKGKRDKTEVDDQEMIKCSECGTVGHPSCLDLTNAMVSVIRTYPWQCMECKTCVECMDPYDEDKMMFCDRCDRGYHTFCVGLRSIPTGKWECKSCKGTETPRPRKRASQVK